MKASIIIPTRERCHTLEHSLKSCTAQDYNDLEIIVSDNASTDNTADVVARNRDPRIKYVRTPSRLSMSENWEYALSFATGDFICIIGDDDGFVPGGVRIAMELIRASNSDCVGWQAASYGWPSHPLPEYRSRLSFSARPFAIKRSCSKVWEKFKKQSRGNYGSLCGLYANGFLPRRLFQSRLKRFGAFFQSTQPDIFSAVIATRELSSQVFSYLPLAIGGASGSSNGAAAVLLLINGESADGGLPKEFKEETRSSDFNRRIDFYSSLPLCIADAWLSALDSAESQSEVEIISALKTCLVWGIREAETFPQASASRLLEALASTAKMNGLSEWYKKLSVDLSPDKVYWTDKRDFAYAGLQCDLQNIDLNLNALPISDVASAAELIASILDMRDRHLPVLRKSGETALRVARNISRLTHSSVAPFVNRFVN